MIRSNFGEAASGHCGLAQPGVTGEIRLVNQLFSLAA
jgi:hypothetical protein